MNPSLIKAEPSDGPLYQIWDIPEGLTGPSTDCTEVDVWDN